MESMRWVVVMLAVASCSSTPAGPPVVTSIEPTTAIEGSSVRLTIHGQFALVRHVDFGSGDIAVDARFEAWLGESALEDVRYLDGRTLTGMVPDGLAPGAYDLRVRAPDGRVTTLTALFAVSRRPQRSLVIVEAADVSGAEVRDLVLAPGETVELHAALIEGGDFVSSTTVSWAVSGGAIGALSVVEGPATVLTATAPGSGVVQAVSADGLTDATGVITVRACSAASDCDDGDVCNGLERCEDGRCLAGAPLECPSLGEGCPIPACDPAKGCVTLLGTACDGPDADFCLDDTVVGCGPSGLVCSSGADDREGPPGDPSCSDGIDNDCDGAIDLADPGCGTDTVPPRAVLTVTPAAGVAGPVPTVFVASAAGSSDDPNPASSLHYAWDWDGDGLFADGGAASLHSFSTPGTRTVSVRVTDAAGLSAYASFDIVVAKEGALATVTTGDDLVDGTSPESPGPTGFSLREAVAWAKGIPGPNTILVPSGIVVALGSTLSISDTEGLDVVGDGAVLDGSATGTSADCLSLAGSGIRVFGLEIARCHGYAVIFNTGAGNQVERCSIHHNGNTIAINGPNNTLGPGNDIAFHGSTAVQVNSAGGGAHVVGNRIHDNTGNVGVYLNTRNADPGSLVERNVIYGNTGDGVWASVNVPNNTIRFNTIVANTGYGIELNTADGTVVVGNAVTGNGKCGIYPHGGTFTRLERNALFGNGPGTGCAGPAPGDVTTDPLYLGAPAHDYRLASASPLVDAAPDVGLDVNGPAPLLFDGAAPDIGAWESP